MKIYLAKLINATTDRPYRTWTWVWVVLTIVSISTNAFLTSFVAMILSSATDSIIQEIRKIRNERKLLQACRAAHDAMLMDNRSKWVSRRSFMMLKAVLDFSEGEKQ